MAGACGRRVRRRLEGTAAAGSAGADRVRGTGCSTEGSAPPRSRADETRPIGRGGGDALRVHAG